MAKQIVQQKRTDWGLWITLTLVLIIGTGVWFFLPRNTGSRVCERAESIVLREMRYEQESRHAEDHIVYAEIFSRLAREGCPENTRKYQQMAVDELKIARTIINSLRKGDYTNNMNGEAKLSDEIRKIYIELDMQEIADEFNRSLQRTARAVSGFLDSIKDTKVSIEVH